ncbi:MAG: helix-turn-helix domain-containing protein [Chitinispirillaceae bacterium]|nr:helix-turn-helix domain-containing protein [Chitinispirillaceae bacterium]MBN2771414.1 helix-turn-helix domain-containing protein [Spirochaetota bacterium]
MTIIQYLIEVANYISIFSIMYSIILFFITVKIRMHPSFPYLCLAILLLALLPNNCFISSTRGLRFTIIATNIKLILFHLAMIVLGRAFILIGLHKKIIYTCMLPFAGFIITSLLSIFLDIDFLLYNTPTGLTISLFYKTVFFPTLVTVFIVVLADMIYKMKTGSVLNSKIIRLLVIGLVFLIFFGVTEMLYYIIFQLQFEITSMFFSISSFGILIFNIYTLMFISEIIRNNITTKRLFIQNNDSFVKPENNRDKTIYDLITNTIIQEKLYTNPDIDLESLSKFTGIHRNEISRVVNLYSSENFKGFINRFRVNRLKLLLSDPALHDYPIQSLGYRVGFNSKATLNRVFKEYEGISPIEYRGQKQNTKDKCSNF